MTRLGTTVDPHAPDHAQARTAALERLAALDAEHAKALEGGGDKYTARHKKRGKLLARERVELLLDPDTPFLELSPLAAWGSDHPVGASMVTGIGTVEGVECLITANDPTVRGGASNPWTLKKALRANEIARQNRLPVISLVESGGADLPSQKEIFIPGGAIFRDLTRLSAEGIPTVAVVFGNSTAGGAYIPGMSDHTIMIKDRSKVFLGGPPLVKMATGEESDDESLGGADMHARTSGLADHYALDEYDAIRQARRVVARLNHRKPHQDPPKAEEPLHDPEELLGIVPPDLKTPSTRARSSPGSSTPPTSTSSSPSTAPASSPDGPPCTATRSASSPTRRACSSAPSPRKPPSSSSSPTSATSPSSSSTTPPATWSARSTSRAASSNTAR